MTEQIKAADSIIEAIQNHWVPLSGLEENAEFSRILANSLEGFPLFVSCGADEIMLVRLDGPPITIEIEAHDAGQCYFKVSVDNTAVAIAWHIPQGTSNEDVHLSMRRLLGAIGRIVAEINGGVGAKADIDDEPQGDISQIAGDVSHPNSQTEVIDAPRAFVVSDAQHDFGDGYPENLDQAEVNPDDEPEDLTYEEAPRPFFATKRFFLGGLAAIAICFVAGAAYIHFGQAGVENYAANGMSSSPTQSSVSKGGDQSDPQYVIKAFAGHTIQMPGMGTLKTKDQFKFFGMSPGPEMAQASQQQQTN